MNDTLFMHVYSRTVLLVEEKGKSWEADARLSRRRINESWHGTHRGLNHEGGRVKSRQAKRKWIVWLIPLSTTLDQVDKTPQRPYCQRTKTRAHYEIGLSMLPFD